MWFVRLITLPVTILLHMSLLRGRVKKCYVKLAKIHLGYERSTVTRMSAVSGTNKDRQTSALRALSATETKQPPKRKEVHHSTYHDSTADRLIHFGIQSFDRSLM